MLYPSIATVNSLPDTFNYFTRIRISDTYRKPWLVNMIFTKTFHMQAKIYIYLEGKFIFLQAYAKLLCIYTHLLAENY